MDDQPASTARRTDQAEMTIEWDVPIRTAAGNVLRADVFRPAAPGRYPVIMTHGVYGKGLPIERLRQHMLAQAAAHPQLSAVRGGADLADTVDPRAAGDVAPDDYRVWEVVDPSVWVPAGYACVRIDSRGTGTSPGRLDPMATDEIDDYADCVEWAGTRPWSTGRVGLCGKSYYAMTQWLVAARRPRHLAAICVWHGLSDWYRDATRHGGIMYQFWERFWYPSLVLPVQHGAGDDTSPHSGLPITGPDVLDAGPLAARRTDIGQDIRDHPLRDDYHRQRSPDLGRIEVPLLAAADWSDHDLHLRGTIRGFRQVASQVSSQRTWLEIHAGGQFDDPEAVELQMRFFDYHLRDGQGDWAGQPRVRLAVRQADGSHTRLDATDWPVPGTRWTPLYADLGSRSLREERPADDTARTYDGTGDGVTLLGPVLEQEITVLGPVSARLFLSASTADADLFLTLDAIDPAGRPVELRDHRAGLTPMSVGWQRASLRATEPARSTPGQPFHAYDTAAPLEPGEIAEVEVEMCPTSLRLPAGHRLRLTIRGHGPAHDDPSDRPPAVFHNQVTLHAGPDHPSQLLIPALAG